MGLDTLLLRALTLFGVGLLVACGDPTSQPAENIVAEQTASPPVGTVTARQLDPGYLSVGEGIAPLLEGIGEVSFPITSTNAKAQAYFNQALTFSFGFNHAEAARSFGEAARLLADNGRMALVIHCREDQIHGQNEVDLKAVKRVQDCRFVDRAHRMFEAGFAAARGADRAPYDQAAEQLAPAVAELESIMTEYGQDVANDTIAVLYSEVARFHSRLQHYDPDEVLAWLARMGRELDTYRGRITSMLGAAIDQAGFLEICEILTDRGLTLEEHGPLLPVDSKVPLAWAILAKK